jgi:hypothetical protein
MTSLRDSITKKEKEENIMSSDNNIAIMNSDLNKNHNKTTKTVTSMSNENQTTKQNNIFNINSSHLIEETNQKIYNKRLNFVTDYLDSLNAIGEERVKTVQILMVLYTIIVYHIVYIRI